MMDIKMETELLINKSCNISLKKLFILHSSPLCMHEIN